MIFFFSGNGNSEFAANALGCRLDEENIRIDASTPLSFDASGWRRVVWVFPVYSWGIPQPVRSFMDKVMLSNLPEYATHHMVATCGDDAGLTHVAWRKAIAARGWRVKAPIQSRCRTHM